MEELLMMVNQNINENNDNDILTERTYIKYNMYDQERINYQKDIISTSIKLNQLEGKSIIYHTQQACSYNIISKLCKREIINIMVLALTQSGKTGTMVALIKNYLNTPNNEFLIPIENIFIITGLSSNEWVEQTKKRMPEIMQKNVFHRGKLNNKFIEKIKNKKNVLIIIDEIQIAAKEKQTLFKTFKDAGFYDKQNLFKNDIKIIEFSATPDGTIYDNMKWKDNADMIFMEHGKDYTSCFDLRNQGRVRQYKDLYCYNQQTKSFDQEKIQNNINEIKELLPNFQEPKYHIIRTPNSKEGQKVIENFKNILSNNIQYRTYNKDSEFKDINVVLKQKPENHTFIFIKEKLRCAKTLYKKYLGILYERYTKQPDDAVIIQGLLGRATGYDDNNETICFTNIDSIDKYEILWNSRFKDRNIKWISKTTKRNKNKEIDSNGTYKSTKHFDNISGDTDDNDKVIEPIIKEFDRFTDVQNYVKCTFNRSRGPNRPSKKIKVNGSTFYKNHIRGIWKIMSKSDIYNNRRWGINNKNIYRLHVCYEDINNHNTVKYLIIHY
jgi:hypothetical protein